MAETPKDDFDIDALLDDKEPSLPSVNRIEEPVSEFATAAPDEDDLLEEDLSVADPEEPSVPEPSVPEPEEPSVPEPSVPEPEEPSVPEPGISPAEAAKIRELEAALAAPSPAIAGLTPAQIKIRELEDALAVKQAEEERALENAAPVYAHVPDGAETILLHFLNDGLIACGQTWYRGQELEFEVGGRAHKEQFDRNGGSWLDLLDDIDAQYRRWGQQMIARGPWRGKSLTEAPIPPEIPAAEHDAYRAALKKAEETERKRGRRAPILR